MDVVEAAKQRVTNVFSNGVRVYMSFSAGKDSLCMSHLVYEKILSGEIDPKLLTVIFIDEEAIYASMEQMALRWHKRFISVGAEFRWYCLPVKQVSCLHQLQNDEAWITWDNARPSLKVHRTDEVPDLLQNDHQRWDTDGWCACCGVRPTAGVSGKR